jgi:hypothetical protein
VLFDRQFELQEDGGLGYAALLGGTGRRQSGCGPTSEQNK